MTNMNPETPYPRSFGQLLIDMRILACDDSFWGPVPMRNDLPGYVFRRRALLG